jgi:hypothetical protein
MPVIAIVTLCRPWSSQVMGMQRSGYSTVTVAGGLVERCMRAARGPLHGGTKAREAGQPRAVAWRLGAVDAEARRGRPA